MRKNQETSLVLPPPPKKTEEEGGSHTTSATVFDLHSFDPWLWLSTSSSFVIRCPRGGRKKTRLIYRTARLDRVNAAVQTLSFVLPLSHITNVPRYRSIPKNGGLMK